MTRQTLLLTGATGAVGHEVVRVLFRDPDPPRLLVLMRGEPRQVSAKLARLLEWAGTSAAAPSLAVLPGDPSKPDLGMTPDDFGRVTSEV
ncbi:MAG TPA: SDR family oxidoreductase, partial [Thermoanaerobaculia bacterium]|nr:SDR family oxidoreductase [Thermoanaerobaculia bacterium]